MKRRISKLGAAVTLGGMLVWGGCGKGADAGFEEALPTFEQLSAELESADSSAPDVEAGDDQNGSQKASAALLGDACHPHLFVRTHEVAARLNLHTAILLNAIREVIQQNPTQRSDTTRIWQGTVRGKVFKLTLTKNDALSYSFSVEAAQVPESGDPAFVVVASGSSQSDGATPAHVVGNATFDFSALKSVVPAERATGSYAIDFDVTNGVSKKLVYHFTQFLPRGGDPHGPRNGTYVYYGKPGVGGSLKYQDTVVLLCPSNPSLLAADLNTVAEWYLGDDSTLHGRADARAFNGQIALGNTWQGVTCFNGNRIQQTAEAYWMMKVEDPLGATLGGAAFSSPNSTPASCDSAFIDGNAQTPSLTDNSKDFPFAATFNADGTLKNEDPFLFPKIQ